MVVVRTFSNSRGLTLVFALMFLFSVGMILNNAFADKVVATIQVGVRPEGVSVNPDTNMIYVANSDSNSISVIDGYTNGVVNTIPVNFPLHLGVNPNTNKIYVSDTSELEVIDGSTNSVVSTVSTAAIAVAVNPNTNRIYTTGAYEINVVDGETNTVIASVPIRGHPIWVAVNPSTNMIYVTSTGYTTVPQGYLTIINGTTNTVQLYMILGIAGGGVDVNPNTNRIYDSASDQIYVIDGPTNNQIAAISSGEAGLLAVNPITNKVYVTNWNSNSVSVIDGTTNNVTSTIPVGNGPFNVAVNPNTNMIYASNQNSGTISVIDGSTIPSAPQNLMATTVSSSQINLSWNAPSNNGGSAISGYMIERSSDDGTTWSTIVPNTGSTSTTFSDTGLDKKTTYTYRIHAINGVGISLPSDIVSATTFKNNHHHHKSI